MTNSKRFSKNNHYCVVHFSPKLMTDKHFFLFEGGRLFKDEEMKKYIEWHCGNQPDYQLNPIKIEYRVSPDRIMELEKEDPIIDWSTCNRNWFKWVESNDSRWDK